jgi:hypothetical protein
MCPVGALEGLFLPAGDASHERPGDWIGRAGEDHAIVEEHGFHWSWVGEFHAQIVGDAVAATMNR